MSADDNSRIWRWRPTFAITPCNLRGSVGSLGRNRLLERRSRDGYLRGAITNPRQGTLNNPRRGLQFVGLLRKMLNIGLTQPSLEKVSRDLFGERPLSRWPSGNKLPVGYPLSRLVSTCGNPPEKRLMDLAEYVCTYIWRERARKQKKTDRDLSIDTYICIYTYMHTSYVDHSMCLWFCRRLHTSATSI